jgi:hypothetical protein
LEVGGWRFEVGGWRFEVGGSRLEEERGLKNGLKVYKRLKGERD